MSLLSEQTLAKSRKPVTVRRAAYSFGVGGSYGPTMATFSNIGIRHPIRLPINTIRWRLVLSNYDYMRAAVGADGHSVRAVYLGKHQRGTGTNGTGLFESTPVLAVPDPNAAIPSDGTQYKTPWVTDPNAQLQANVEHLVSYDVTALAPVNTQRASGRSWIAFGLGTSGSMSPNPAPSDSSAILFDTYVEYEFVDDGTHPVGLFLGDSITEGKALYPNQSWPSQFSRLTGTVPINIACAGTQTNYWTSGSVPLWTRLPIATYAPDFAFYTIGTNDAASSVTLATLQSNVLATVNLMATSFGIKTVYLGNVAPKTGLTAGNAEDLLRQSYRNWFAALPCGVAGMADFDTVLRDPASTLQMRGDWMQGDGLHPTTAGCGRMAREARSLIATAR